MGNKMFHPRMLILSCSVLGLSACGSYYHQDISQIDATYPYHYESIMLYQENSVNDYPYSGMTYEKKSIEVPETYHVGAYRAPTSPAERDKEWVHQQSTQGFTIQLADDDKANQVANTLYKAPKKEHTAEIKYQRDGKTYYKGLYGSYPTYEAAQKAFNALPPDLQQKAGIKSWDSIQKSE